MNGTEERHPINIVCFGASTTQGKRHAECDRWTNLLQRALEGRAPGRYRVFNRGQGGQTSADGLARIMTDVVPLLPGIVLLQFGFNDASVGMGFHVPRVSVSDFLRNIREIDRIVTQHGGRTACIINHLEQSPGEQGNGLSYTENHAPYESGLRRLTAEFGLSAIDLPAMMRDREIALDEFLIDDGIHLSVKGSHIYAEMILEGLRDLLP